MKVAAPAMNTACTAKIGGDRPAKADPTNAATIMVQAKALYLGAIAPCCSQSAIIGPKIRWSCNHRRSFGALFAKANAASKTKGVVGKTGKTIPIAPITRQTAPIKNHTVFAIIVRDKFALSVGSLGKGFTRTR